LGPLAISIAIMQTGKTLEATAKGESMLASLVGIAFDILVFVGVGILNFKAASKLSNKIDKLKNKNQS